LTDFPALQGKPPHDPADDFEAVPPECWPSDADEASEAPASWFDDRRSDDIGFLARQDVVPDAAPSPSIRTARVMTTRDVGKALHSAPDEKRQR
jgi:hypothetical protein